MPLIRSPDGQYVIEAPSVKAAADQIDRLREQAATPGLSGLPAAEKKPGNARAATEAAGDIKLARS